MMITPVSKFGKDHWSLLAYIETLCVDGRGGVGTLDKRRVRCNENAHPLHVGSYQSNLSWKPNYGTRLFGYFDFPERADVAKAVEAGFQLLDHDDWDCMNDLEAAGFIEVISEANGFVRMMELGCKVAAQLREHKASGGMFAGFVMGAVAPVAA